MKTRYLDAVIAAGQSSRSVALATELKSGAQLLLDSGRFDGELALDEAQRAAMREALRADRNVTLETAGGRVFVQVFSPPMRCFVVGAVHIAQPLTQMLALTGYHAVVIDPRQSFATEARFPGVTLITEWPGPALKKVGLDDHTAVVTLTHDPKLDDPALCAALQSPVFYIGALGSSRTHAKRIERLREHGLAEFATRIHAPVGLDLGGRAAAEIAVSVLAQVIQERYRR